MKEFCGRKKYKKIKFFNGFRNFLVSSQLLIKGNWNLQIHFWWNWNFLFVSEIQIWWHNYLEKAQLWACKLIILTYCHYFLWNCIHLGKKYTLLIHHFSAYWISQLHTSSSGIVWNHKRNLTPVVKIFFSVLHAYETEKKGFWSQSWWFTTGGSQTVKFGKIRLEMRKN